MRSLRYAPILLGALLTASTAGALNQSTGQQIPETNRLVTALNGEGETIDPLNDAAVTPETFTPNCALTFKVIARGAGQNNSFGWYNVTGSRPANNELFEFITCSDGVGTEKVLDIRSDPRYTGGDVGFFLATTEGASGNCVNFTEVAAGNNNTLGFLYFSERAYNDDNMGGGNPFIHLLIMDSKVIPDAFYFGWEDLFNGGDNDFEDLLTRVTGIRCTGGGEPCDVSGQQGRCARGATQCVNGEIECVQTVQPTAEKCNAIDDDCNGDVDEGDLCQPNEVCFRGKCQPKCGGGEFQCAGDFTCNTEGVCVDPDCENVSCPAEQTCVDGTCVGACDGITCPFGQDCRAGACVDPCEGVTCEQNFVCIGGVCTLGCGCAGCEGGNTCDSASDRCVEPACDMVSCMAGTHCVGGNCVDDCDGAKCPTGEVCEMGGCVVDTSGAGGAAGGGSGGDGGTFAFGGTSGTAGSSGSGGSAADAGSSGSAGDGTGASPGVVEGDGGGCGCRIAGERAPLHLAVLAALGAGVGRRRRRRR